MSLEVINMALGIGSLALQIFAAAFLAVFLLEKSIPDLRDIGSFLATWGIWIGLLLTAAATAMSLIHAHVFDLSPCYLCWWQRIFIYPQIVLFAVALWRRDASVAYYSIVLSVLGAGIALYHHLLQLFPTGPLPCSATGPNCAEILFLEFGYITYPMMSISLFAFLIVAMIFVRRRSL